MREKKEKIVELIIDLKSSQWDDCDDMKKNLCAYIGDLQTRECRKDFVSCFTFSI